MGVESGIGISSSSSIGVGGLESFGVKMTAPFSSPVSEGPVGRNRFNLGVELNSPETAVPAVFQSGLLDINLDPGINPSVPNLDVFDSPAPEVATVEPALSSLTGIKPVIESIAPQVDPKIAPWMEYIYLPTIQPAVGYTYPVGTGIFSKPEIKTENTLAIQPVIQTQFENRISPKTNLVSPVKAAPEQLVEEEKVDRTKALHVIDKKGVVKRIVHTVGVLVGALQIKKGAKEKRLPISIKGSEAVAQLLPSNKSEIRGGEINSKDPEEKLPDKTWDATLERLEQLEFATKEQIIRQVPKIVEENHPVTLAIEGEVASQKNILRSHEHICEPEYLN